MAVEILDGPGRGQLQVFEVVQAEWRAATVIHPVEVTRLATAEAMSPAVALPGGIHMININAKIRWRESPR
jgi:hypothetical protein